MPDLPACDFCIAQYAEFDAERSGMCAECKRLRLEDEAQRAAQMEKPVEQPLRVTACG